MMQNVIMMAWRLMYASLGPWATPHAFPVLSNPGAGAETVRKTPSRALVAQVVNN